MNAGVHAHAGADVSFIDVKINNVMHRKVNDAMYRKRTEDFGRFEKVSWVEFCLGRRRLAFACPSKPGQWLCGACHTCWGGYGKVIIERLCISLPYVETFNSKVIKGFVPELRSHYVFFVFRDSCVPMIYTWTFYVRFTYPYLAMLNSLQFNFMCHILLI